MQDKLKTISLAELYGKGSLHELLEEQAHEGVPNGYQRIKLENAFLQATLMKFICADLIVSYQDWTLKEPFQLVVNHDQELIKVQFELEGHSRFESTEQGLIEIPDSHFQFIHIPRTQGTLTYTTSRKVLDIYVQEAYLFDLLRTQGYSEKQVRNFFYLQNYTFCKQPHIIRIDQAKLIQEMLNHPYQADFAKVYIRTKATELILSVFHGAHDRLPKSKWSEQDIKIIQDVLHFLNTEYHTELHLKELTRKFGINEFKLKVAFKDLVGETVFTYIRKKRLAKAQELLRDTDMDIKEIAFLTGFKYPHHFSKVYYNYFNELPSAHRKSKVIH